MSPQCALFIGDGAWRLGLVTGSSAQIVPLSNDTEMPLESRLAQVKERLAAHGFQGRPVLLVVPSNWCLNAVFPGDRLERGERRKALAFRMEEHLPISAEDFVADYHQADGDLLLGVCVETARLSDLVAAFDTAGIPLQHICPHGLLVAAFVWAQHRDAGRILMGSGQEEGFELLDMGKSGPTRWAWFATNNSEFHDELAAWQTSSTPQTLYVIGPMPPVAGPLDDQLAAQSRVLDEWTADQAATLEAVRILDGVVRPWIDFRRDALGSPDRLAVYRKPLVALAVAALVFLLCVSMAALILGRRYQAQARQQQAGQIAVFQRLFPDQRAPSAVASLLRGEQQRLAALNGQAAEDASQTLSSQTSALISLHDILQNLPADSRYQVMELDIQPDFIRIEGKSLTLVDADRLAAALRKTGLMEVDAPKTEALKEGGVSFAFAAKPKHPAAQEVAHARP